MPKKEYEVKKEGGLLRFGESYTSLVLGIVVVIVATVLLLSFVHSKNANKENTSTLPVEKIAQIEEETNQASDGAKNAPTATPTLTPTVTPTPTVTNTAKKATAAPTAKKVSPAPTAKAAKKVSPSPTVDPKKIANNTKEATIGGVYTVKEGDTLWAISERVYKSGYNWVDIARVNKVSNPNTISAGMKLNLPKVQSKVATVVTPSPTKVKTPTPTMAKKVTTTNESKKVEQKGTIEAGKKITASEYTVVRGDSLWTIAIRAYGDGYQWVKIAQANKLVNPDFIHKGNKLKIPRGK